MMTLRYRLTGAAAALTFALTLAACGNDDPDTAAPGEAGSPSASVPLKDTDWFRTNFGTPLVAAGAVTPRTIEQPKDIKGTALPQNKAALDGLVMWERVRCAAVPFTTTSGPTSLRGDAVWGGFAHTQLGAALAAYHMRYAFWTANHARELIQIAAPADRDRVWKRLQFDQAKASSSMSDPDCILTAKRGAPGLTRPARWSSEQLSADTELVTYWFPPVSAGQQGYTIDIAVRWVDGDWYLTDQELTKEALEADGVPTAEPTGWTAW
ncbi:hypothetical protein AB0C65_35660 [Nocardia sp. NPDC048505]|uniref:hypothetical protein n=1 Tax=Nocardia sp. NPDC048505 TaxID=3155756 RepID=UPI0033FC9FBE